MTSSRESSKDQLRALVAGTLELLQAYHDHRLPAKADGPALPSLLAQCEALCQTRQSTGSDPLRSLHHFACTGGTIISRALAAQPNIVLLSEVDPFSPALLGAGQYAPTDLIMLSQAGLREMPVETIRDMFLGSLKALHADLRRRGQFLVLRDHTHSHFCVDRPIEARPLLRDVLAMQAPVVSIVTVRHPLDSFLSLVKQGWLHFPNPSIETYARRYLSFLDHHAGVPVFRYEDFVAEPDQTVGAMAKRLHLPYQPDWQSVLPVVHLSGDSGRRGDTIASRSRREVPQEIRDSLAGAKDYHGLCERLGYDWRA